MSHQGNEHDTAIILKVLQDRFYPDWSASDFRFYSVHRRPMTIEALVRSGIVENTRRGWYAATPAGRRWIEENAKVFDPVARSENPGRPPKNWMKRCVAGVKAGGSAADPGAVCGAQWYKKMSESQKRAALKKERAGNPSYGYVIEYDPSRKSWIAHRSGEKRILVSASTVTGVKRLLTSRGYAGYDPRMDKIVERAGNPCAPFLRPFSVGR